MLNADCADERLAVAKESFIIRRADLGEHVIAKTIVGVLVRCHSIDIYELKKIIEGSFSDTVRDLYAHNYPMKHLNQTLEFINEKFQSVNNHKLGEEIMLAHVYKVTVDVGDEYHHRVVLVCN